MVQIFAYYEHMQTGWRLELRKSEPVKIRPAKIRTCEIFARDYKITWFFLTRQIFVYYSTPDAPVSMGVAYHCPDGERSMAEKFENYNFKMSYSNRKFKLYEVCTNENLPLYGKGRTPDQD